MAKVYHGTVLDVYKEYAGSPTTQDAFTGDTVLYLEDASDFAEEGGTLVLDDGIPLEYDSADLDADTVSLTVPLARASLGGLVAESFVLVHPMITWRSVSLHVDGFDEPMIARVPHHYWPWLPLGARDDTVRRETIRITFDGEDWSVTDIEGAAVPGFSKVFADPRRVLRYEVDGALPENSTGVKLTEVGRGTIQGMRIECTTAPTDGDVTLDLILSGTDIGSATVSSGDNWSDLSDIANVPFNAHDRFRIFYADADNLLGDDTHPNYVYVFVTLDND